VECNHLDKPFIAETCNTTAHCDFDSSSIGGSKADERVVTNEMALILTGILTGAAVVSVTILWLCRILRRSADDKLMQTQSVQSDQLGHSESSSQLPSSSSGDEVAKNSVTADGIAAAAVASGAGLHKTPRSIPRAIQVHGSDCQ